MHWKVLKHRLVKEGNETVTNCNQLKLRAEDGKMRMTDVADTEQLFRLIQSIPSPKAEPFKRWMAQVAAERLDQMQDPELSIEQAVEDYRRLGYSESWINQRLKSIEVRKLLTDEWKRKHLGTVLFCLTDSADGAAGQTGRTVPRCLILSWQLRTPRGNECRFRRTYGGRRRDTSGW